MPILECVPNFSEGRDKSKIEQILHYVRAAAEVDVLDLHSDPDHNRSVLTMTGESEHVVNAAFALTEKAAELININKHTGVHPFIGAVDVIPFIPVKGTTMAHASKAAVDVSMRIWNELKIPIYLYGEASFIPHRSNLANVRRGGLKVLREEIETEERHPDIGDPKLHPRAGAVAVGARNFLIAFNVNLDSKDLALAKEIAKSIREKHGGLAGVKALGVPLESRGGIVQVTVNITDHQETSIKDVFNSIRSKAKARGVQVLESELVGLIPEDAAFPHMDKYLKLKEFDESKILTIPGNP
ncbi:MAG: glutamate formimidoyltransferase [Candidatus Margulisbacteria bacterium]|nr:glutamate formimidoyltransferase [Candidatus Margulisiibacteriota bacterium]MBU1021907.1 glutamate formimidoyltransferase [Candidatus Margulisiibacteriota bacterium]MBU1728545.1 glutamate formimidoyltransferase [Candidatus Margulisiibacteriota bacterium]MBU1954692.1 glutamate formimidoyltransferase [Candidatus Margulisiibacteriota bacterium]